jgi:hypothetical protein
VLVLGFRVYLGDGLGFLWGWFRVNVGFCQGLREDWFRPYLVLLWGFFRVALRFLEGLFVVDVPFFNVPMGSSIDRLIDRLD